MEAPKRVTGVYKVTDGRYDGEAFWLDLFVDETHPVDKNGQRWSFACDRATAMRLRLQLNKALRA